MMQHVHGTAERPSRRTELPIPPALDDLIMDLLAKDPAARPQSADAVGARLHDIRADPPWTAEWAVQWWDLHYPKG